MFSFVGLWYQKVGKTAWQRTHFEYAKADSHLGGETFAKRAVSWKRQTQKIGL